MTGRESPGRRKEEEVSLPPSECMTWGEKKTGRNHLGQEKLFKKLRRACRKAQGEKRRAVGILSCSGSSMQPGGHSKSSSHSLSSPRSSSLPWSTHWLDNSHIHPCSASIPALFHPTETRCNGEEQPKNKNTAAGLGILAANTGIRSSLPSVFLCGANLSSFIHFCYPWQPHCV